MQDNGIRRRDLTTTYEDETMERSVLTQVLLLHPAQLTILELALPVETEFRDCERDAGRARRARVEQDVDAARPDS